MTAPRHGRAGRRDVRDVQANPGVEGGTMTRAARREPDIDPFRRRQVPEVAGRFLRERKQHQRQSDLMWLGVLTALFSDHELKLLDDLGYLSEHDRRLLRQAGRQP